jgi:hypothetical protein
MEPVQSWAGAPTGAANCEVALFFMSRKTDELSGRKPRGRNNNLFKAV